MEYLTGDSLSTVIARNGALPQARVVAIARQVVRGLAHAHERGIVHRDLKPDNMMLVTEDDEDDIVKLLDFGITQIRASSNLTTTGKVLGTRATWRPSSSPGRRSTLARISTRSCTVSALLARYAPARATARPYGAPLEEPHREHRITLLGLRAEDLSYSQTATEVAYPAAAATAHTVVDEIGPA